MARSCSLSERHQEQSFQSYLGVAIENINIIKKWITYIIGLSQLTWTMGKLAVLLQWALSMTKEMLAHLSLILLLQSVELALVSVEVVIVGLLCKVAHHFSWWVVEILLWRSIWPKLSSVLGFCLSSSWVKVGSWTFRGGWWHLSWTWFKLLVFSWSVVGRQVVWSLTVIVFINLLVNIVVERYINLLCCNLKFKKRVSI